MVSDMEVDMVADMEVDKVTDMVADIKVDMVADIVADMKVDMEVDMVADMEVDMVAKILELHTNVRNAMQYHVLPYNTGQFDEANLWTLFFFNVKLIFITSLSWMRKETAAVHQGGFICIFVNAVSAQFHCDARASVAVFLLPRKNL